MSEESPNLKLPYIMPSQAQKHVTHNEAIRALDALVQLGVLERGLQSPPLHPTEGARYIVGDGPTDAWEGHAGKIAAYQDGAWAFFLPRSGWLAHVAAEDLLVVHDGADWRDVRSGLSPEILQNFPNIGINTTSDETNRLAISAPATLLTHEGAGHQLKVNKNTAGDTASLLFQTGWSGRAEVGLAGNDEFSIKVSPDGADWYTALSVSAASSVVSLGSTVKMAGPAPSLVLTETDTSTASRLVLQGSVLALQAGAAGQGETGSSGVIAFAGWANSDIGALKVRHGGELHDIHHAGAPIKLREYTVAQMPSASGAGLGAMIFVTDEQGGAVPAFSDGSQWRRVTDREAISV